MPLRKQMAVGHDDATTPTASVESAADTPEIVETTAEVPVSGADEAASAPATIRHRWRLFRRKATPSEPADRTFDEAAEKAEETPEPAPVPRTPVGKRGRTTKAVDEQESQVERESVEATVESETEDAVEVDTILVPHRPAGRRLKFAAAAAGVLFIGAAAFAGATVQPYLVDRALVHTKLDIARTAARAITTLWSYTPDDMESLADRSARYLGGDFAVEYRKYIDAIVAPNKQAQVTNTTQVMGTAVERVTPSEATAIVYTNSVATSPVSKNIPSLRYLSYRLTMQRHDADWLITRMSTVTSFDLTPQL
jgi:Mce-associated membrane protein